MLTIRDVFIVRMKQNRRQMIQFMTIMVHFILVKNVILHIILNVYQDINEIKKNMRKMQQYVNFVKRLNQHVKLIVFTKIRVKNIWKK